MQAPITKEAQREEELSMSDFISLSFCAACKIILPVGAYIVHTYYIDQTRKVTQRFSLLEPYEPVQTDEMSWKYMPEFQHPKMLLGKIPFYIKTKNSQNETIKQTNWTFVGTPDVIMGKICDFLNKDIQFGKCGWKSVLSGELKNSLSVSFSDNDVLSALSSIANAEGDTCEWHIDYDNEDIYLGKVILDNTSISLEVGKNIGTPSVTESKENYYNSYTVFGGTRNITQTNSLGENVSSSDIRLQLASGKGIVNINGKEIEYTVDDFSTIDLRKDKTKEPLLTKVLNFSDVFPSLNTYVYKVRGRKKYVLDDTTKKKIPLTYNADGSVAAYKIFTVWYMRLAYCTTTEDKTKKLVNKTVDNGVTHYWYDFELTDNLIVNGKTLSCSFEANTNINALSTPLAGRGTNGEHVGFELKYHKDNYSAHDSDDVDSANFNILSGDYEIIYQEDNNLIIPTNEDERLIPRGESLPSLSCNITVLYNIAMSEQYQKDAQEKLLDKAIKEIERLNSDLNNYEFSVYPQVFEANNPRLQIGQKVKYSDGQGYTLDTRILKLTTNLDYDFIQEITVGNQANKGTVTQLKDDVQTIIANSSNGNSSSYSGSQFNSIVSKYGSKYFLSKQYDDIAQGQIRFMKGLKIGDGEKGVDAKGNAKLADAVLGDVVVDRVHDAKSTPADRVMVGAQGFDLYMGADGKSHMYVDYLVARAKFFAASAEVRKVSYSGGTTIFSNAGSTIAKVTYVFDAAGERVIAYKCYALADDGTTRTMNWWHVGMMALCQTFNVKDVETERLQNRYYWRMVIGVGQETLEDSKLYDYVILSNVREFAGGEAMLPNKGVRVLADETGRVLRWGGVAVATVYDGELVSMAELFAKQEKGRTADEGGNVIAQRVFYGYEAVNGGEPDAPAEGDVIVQVGDQIRWKSHGNVIKLSTSTEDNATETAPAITMYHQIGALWETGAKDSAGEPVRNPYQWKEVTCVISPGQVLLNARRFKLFTDSVDNIIEPYVVMYTVVPSCSCIVRHTATRSTTPEVIGAETVKRVGNTSELVSNSDVKYMADVVWQDGNGVETMALTDVHTRGLYNVKSLKIKAYMLKDAKKMLAECDIAVATDGEQGEDGKPGTDGKPGADGADGWDGKDAAVVVINPSVLTVDTVKDGSGNPRVDCSGEKVKADVRIEREGVSIVNECDRYEVVDKMGCTAHIADGGTKTMRIVVDSIVRDEYLVGSTKRYIPRTTATATVRIHCSTNNSYYYATLTVNVNVSGLWSELTITSEKLSSKYSEISNSVEGMKGELKQYDSKIEQTARNIALKVSQTTLGRKNLLVGSALRRQGEGVRIQTQEGGGIETIGGVGGVNCVHVVATTANHYSGLFWWGITPNDTKCIKIEKNKTYTASVWVKCDRTDAKVYIEAKWAETATGGERLDSVIQSGDNLFSVKQANTWQFFSVTFNTNDETKFKDYIEMNFWVNNKTEGITTNAWFCQPMLVEGDEYVGWSLSEEDAEYIGGNLLDNTDTLKTGGTLTVATENTFLHPTGGSADEIAGQTYNGCATLNSDARYYSGNIDTVKWNLGDTGFVKQGQDYMFSFMAKGKKGGQFTAYFYKSDTTEKVFVEVLDRVNGSNQHSAANGNARVEFKENYVWKRYWVHWRVVGGNLPKYVLIRCLQGYDLYVSQPKLEYGATVTEYTTSRSMSSRLLDAGIDINSKQIMLTADKTKFRTQSGDEVAVFDDKGINAKLLNVDNAVANVIKTNELTAKNLNVTGSSTFGIWKIGKDTSLGCDIITADNTTVGGATIVGSMIQYTPAFVRSGSIHGGYMRTGAYVTEFGHGDANGSYYTGIWLGKSAYTVAYGGTNVWSLPPGYGVSGVNVSRLVAYVYSPSEGETPSVYMNKPNGGVVMETNAVIRGVFANNVLSTSTDGKMGNSTGLFVANSEYETTVQLPTNPVTGQQVTVIQKGGGKVKIQSNKSIRTAGDTSSTNQRVSNYRGQISLFIYDGTDWNCTYITGKMTQN